MEGLLDPADPDAADPELEMTVAGRAMWYRLMLLPGNEKSCVISLYADTWQLVILVPSYRAR